MNRTIKEITEHPSMIVKKVANRIAGLPFVSSETTLKVRYRNMVGQNLNLESPATFNEKIQWLKLHDKNPAYTNVVDKIAFKDWVTTKLGPGHVPATLGVWSSAKDVEFGELPSRFVLKTNHDSGTAIVVKEKGLCNPRRIRRKLGRSLRRNYYYRCREWPYRNVVPRVFAEEYLENCVWRRDSIPFRLEGGRAEVVLAKEDSGSAEEELVAAKVGVTLGESAATRGSRWHEESPAWSEVVRLQPLGSERGFLDGPGEELSVSIEGNASDLFRAVVFAVPESRGGGFVEINAGKASWLHVVPCTEELKDYKFMCYEGKVGEVFVCSDRASGDLRVDFFDREWNHLPFTRHYPNANVLPERPSRLDEMIGIAEKLSAGIPFVRVDLYDLPGRPILVGELTFYPGSGFEEFTPAVWDRRLGDEINLSLAYDQNRPIGE